MPRGCRHGSPTGYAAAGTSAAARMGGPRSEVPTDGLVLFRAASRRTGLDGFPIIRLSSDYCVSGAAGCPVWIWSWQEAQTTRVLRRLLAMALAHKGWSGPGLPRSASARTW